MSELQSVLVSMAAENGLAVSPKQAQQFQAYFELLVEWNAKINLTAITEPDAVAEKHFLDSILILKHWEFPQGAKVIDVGTGAGFPGVPLKIMRPDLDLTLLDGLNKRIVFLRELLKTLGLVAETVHGRAEELGREEKYRLSFDFATARAVARMPVLCEYCLPFVKQGGVFAAMKGPGAQEEAESAKKAAAVLGCSIEKAVDYTLPSGDGRSLILIRRTAALAQTYPRHGAKISKQPLA